MLNYSLKSALRNFSQAFEFILRWIDKHIVEAVATRRGLWLPVQQGVLVQFLWLKGEERVRVHLHGVRLLLGHLRLLECHWWCIRDKVVELVKALLLEVICTKIAWIFVLNHRLRIVKCDHSLLQVPLLRLNLLHGAIVLSDFEIWLPRNARHRTAHIRRAHEVLVWIPHWRTRITILRH